MAYFLNLYQAKSMGEIFAGGGTGSDVCRDMGIDYCGIDLNPNPVRDDIISMDIMDDNIELPEKFYSCDMLFMHPPYPSISGISYANNLWKGDASLNAKDIQQMGWEDGMKAVNHSVMRGYAALQPGAYQVVLIGDIRSKGQFRSMLADLVKPTELHQMFCKIQHNCVSNRSNNSYSRSDRALTGHEMIVVFKKKSGYEICAVIPRREKYDIRNLYFATWRDLIAAVMDKLKDATLPDIYSEIEGCGKVKGLNPEYWQAKVRQTLQKGGYVNVERGRWAMAA